MNHQNSVEKYFLAWGAEALIAIKCPRFPKLVWTLFMTYDHDLIFKQVDNHSKNCREENVLEQPQKMSHSVDH